MILVLTVVLLDVSKSNRSKKCTHTHRQTKTHGNNELGKMTRQEYNIINTNFFA